MRPKLILVLVLAAFAVLFILQNFAVVEIRFLFWTLAMSRALMIFILLVIGMTLGWLLRGLYARRRRE